MFDNISFKRELPLPDELKKLKDDWFSYQFQTKDLDNCLLDFWVSSDGELFEHVIEREYVPFTEKEKKENKKSKKHWSIWKDVIEKDSYDKKVNHHGVIKFYTYDDFDEDTNYSVEFNAYFIYGKLDRIELVEFKLDKERKAFNKKWEEEYKIRAKHPWNIFKHHASRLGWRWFWKKIAAIFIESGKNLEKVGYFIFRHLI